MLEFQNTSIYRREKRVLDDFNLKIPDGAIMGLLGSDSKAKSMILAAASGSQAPDYGQILLDGVSIYQERSRAYRRFGYMPRDYGFYDLLRVDEYFELFLSLYKVNGRYRQKRMEEVAELFGIRQYMSAFIAELPTEILPFLCLAKTVLHDPDWLLLDEPFADLSSASRNFMIKTLLMLQEQGKSIVVNSQMFPETRDFFTDVALVEDGRVTGVRLSPRKGEPWVAKSAHVIAAPGRGGAATAPRCMGCVVRGTGGRLAIRGLLSQNHQNCW